jgi:hypothetical protein
VLHIASSVGWLGISLTLLTLALAGRFPDDASTRTSAYWAMHVLGNVLVIPISLVSLGSGVLLGLGTKWGLLRHLWVTTKLVITTATAALSIFVLRAQINTAYVHSSLHLEGAALGRAATSLVFAGAVSVSLYTFVVVLSVFKPRGLTRRRDPDAARWPLRS